MVFLRLIVLRVGAAQGQAEIWIAFFYFSQRYRELLFLKLIKQFITFRPFIAFILFRYVPELRSPNCADAFTFFDASTSRLYSLKQRQIVIWKPCQLFFVVHYGLIPHVHSAPSELRISRILTADTFQRRLPLIWWQKWVFTNCCLYDNSFGVRY